MIQRILSLILSVTTAAMTLASLPSAYAAEFPAPQIPKGENYLTSCEGLLTALNEGRVDAFLLGQAKTEAQRAQLLSDYGLIFNRYFQEAVLLTLKDNGVVIDEKYNMQNGRQLRNKIKALGLKSDEEMRPFTQGVLKHIKDLSAGFENKIKARVYFQRLLGIVGAIENSPDRAAFEDVVSTAVRITLLATYKAAMLKHDGSDEASVSVLGGGFLMIFTFLMYNWGAVPGHYDFNSWGQYLQTTDFHWFVGTNLIATAGAGLLGVLGGGLSALMTQSITSGVARGKGARLTPQMKTFKGVSDRLDRSVNHLFALYGEEDDKFLGVRSVNDGCETDICDLTPVEIAYMGHIDILEIEALTHEALGELRPAHLRELINSAQDEARKVLENPANTRAQMLLASHVNELTALVSIELGPESEELKRLNIKIDEIQNAVKQLKAMPYNLRRNQLTEERLLKNEMLIAKLQSDIKTLEQMRVDRDGLAKFLAGFKAQVANINEALKPFPETDGQWRHVAEEAVLALDAMKAGLK